MQKLKTLFSVYWTFFKIGSMSFGGGLAMMPMLERELCEKRHWITEQDLIDYYAIGQSTPGIVAVNVSTFAGYKKAGVFGGIFGTLGMITPSLIIITLLATLINSFSDQPIVKKALDGVNVAVAALMTKIILNFTKKTIKNIFCFFLMAISFSLVYFFNVPSFYIILGSILIGVVMHFCIWRSKK